MGRPQGCRKRRLRAVAAGLALLVATGGACQDGPDEPLPPPAALGARRFPEGTAVGGLEATYGRLTRAEPDGEECFLFLRFTVAGAVTRGQGCSHDGVQALASDEDTWRVRTTLGDYAHRDGRVWLRMVEWDSLAEEFVLSELELASCGTELRSTEEPEPFLVVHPYRLVTGAAPPGSPACEAST